MERVFITGRGMITPLGNSLAENEVALREGKNGISTIQEFVDVQMESTVGGMADHNVQSELLDRKTRRFCPPVGAMSVVAAEEAFKEAGIPLDAIPDMHMGLVGGQATANSREIYDLASNFAANHRLRNISPFAVPRIMPSSAVSILSLIFGIKGESYDVSAACASSALAIMQAVRLIRSGEYDVVLTGGAEQLDWQTALGFCACRALSTKYNDTPEKASRPFDSGRDGFVLSSGAAYVVLESEKSVRARGVTPICEITGIAANSNAKDMVVPDAAASANVMAAALKNAGLTINDIGYINTHGTATPVGDKVELNAIKMLCGDSGYSPAINSTKSQTGHMVGATGVAEVIFSSIMLEKGFISPTLNLENPDEEFAWADLVKEYREVEFKHALSNSFAFGGSNASIILSKC